MATGLNFNLEEQALPAGKQCMGTSVTRLRRKLARKPSIPSFDKICTKKEDIFGKHPFKKNVGLVPPNLKATSLSHGTSLLCSVLLIMFNTQLFICCVTYHWTKDVQLDSKIPISTQYAWHMHFVH